MAHGVMEDVLLEYDLNELLTLVERRKYSSDSSLESCSDSDISHACGKLIIGVGDYGPGSEDLVQVLEAMREAYRVVVDPYHRINIEFRMRGIVHSYWSENNFNSLPKRLRAFSLVPDYFGKLKKRLESLRQGELEPVDLNDSEVNTLLRFAYGAIQNYDHAMWERGVAIGSPVYGGLGQDIKVFEELTGDGGLIKQASRYVPKKSRHHSLLPNEASWLVHRQNNVYSIIPSGLSADSKPSEKK